MSSPADARAVGAAYADTGRPVTEVSFFLIRVGDDFDKYPFKWEPFRDLAGPLKPSDGALPIVMNSQTRPLTSPVVAHEGNPTPHVAITISPGVPVASIVDTWISQLREQGVRPNSSSPWFLESLGLTPLDVAPRTVDFLQAAQPNLQTAPSTDPEPELSQTVREAAATLSPGKVTAWDITSAIAARHLEYAGGRLAGLDGPGVLLWRGEPWPLWRDSVAALFDSVAVADSRHEVIDGRLFIVGLGILDGVLRELLETNDAWVRLLLEIDESVAPPGSDLHGYLASVRFAAGYQSDRASGTDQLQIDGEVNALCDVLLDQDVKPPLSVGLFGEWGSGKTFFMEQMRERIHQATQTPGPRQVRDVVQIRFNAWHYSDSSLWASLAIEIFERLADPEPVLEGERQKWLRDLGDPKADERNSLLDQLETYRTAKAALDAEQKELEARRKAIEARRQEAADRQKRAVESAKIVDVGRAVLDDPSVKKSLKNVETQLGIDASIQELGTLNRELTGTSGYLLATWRRVEHKNWATLLIIAVVVLLIATGALIVRGTNLIAPAVAALGTFTAALTTLSGFVRPAAKQVNSALEVINAAIKTVESAEAKVREERDHEQRRLDLQVAEADREISEASAAAAALTHQIAATEAQADNLTVGRQLFDFLADRSAGYQKHVGVVGMLHRDFRFLDAQLRALAATRADGADEEATAPPGADDGASGPGQVSNDSSDDGTASEGTSGEGTAGERTAEAAGNDAPPLALLPPIDRVILYIDDLDRCPPDKVLEVLEAIHLLLALELFVVVVGVDPRWLRRSLRYQYRHLVTKTEQADDTYLKLMPVEYLEKIFQIPLTLARMNPGGYSRLIASLAPSTTLDTPSSAPPPIAPLAAASAATDNPAPTRALIQVQAGSSAAGPGGSHSLDLTPAELQFAQQLGPLVSSPRAAKRLMNTYRLIRSTQQLGARSRFLGSDGKPGSYQAALLLLAIAAGHPMMADRLLVALERDAAPARINTWTSFVAALNPGVDGGAVGALVPEDIRPGPDTPTATSAATSWADLYRALTQVPRTGGVLDDLKTFQEWGPIVARFSFTL